MEGRDGVRAVAARLGISPNTLIRALAGLGVTRGTLALIERGIPAAEEPSA